MDADGPHAPAQPPVDAAREEERLWQAVLAEPDVEERHHEYFRHATRNNLIKEALRRYGPVVEDKDRFPVETRRVFRRHQQALVNLMFMSAPRAAQPPKRNFVLYMGLFVATLAFMGGLFTPGILAKLVALAGLLGLGIGIILLLQSASKTQSLPGAGSSELGAPTRRDAP